MKFGALGLPRGHPGPPLGGLGALRARRLQKKHRPLVTSEAFGDPFWGHFRSWALPDQKKHIFLEVFLET